MASKKNKQTKEQKELSATKKQEAADYSRLQRLTDYGKQYADSVMPQGSLGRVSETISPEQQDVLSRLNAQTAPTYDEYNSLAAAKNLLDGSGISWAENDSLNALKEEYLRSRTIDPLMQESLGLARQGLNGLNSSENVALRESLNRDAQRQFEGALASIGSARRASGLGGNYGGSALQAMVDQYARAGLESSQTAALKNLEIQDARRKAFTDLASLVDQNMYNRAAATSQAYASGARDLQSNLFNRQRLATSDYGTAARNQATDLNTRLANYSAEVTNQRNDIFKRQLVNLNNLASETSTRLGITMGVPQYVESKASQRQSNNLWEKAIEAAGKAAEAGVPTGVQGPVADEGFKSGSTNGTATV